MIQMNSLFSVLIYSIVPVKNCTIGVKADNTLTADQQAWIGIGLVVFTALLCTGTCLTSLSSQDSNSFDCRKPQFSNQSSQQMKEIIWQYQRYSKYFVQRTIRLMAPWSNINSNNPGIILEIVMILVTVVGMSRLMMRVRGLINVRKFFQWFKPPGNYQRHWIRPCIKYDRVGKHHHIE